MADLKQSAQAVFLVRPASFGFNVQTAHTNHFQDEDYREGDWQGQALLEFNQLVNILQENGIETTVFEDKKIPPKPDAIFPNNWISCHHSGDIVVYPMMTENRRLERRQDIIKHLQQHYGFKRILDLTHWEKENVFLEGTGSIVFDHKNRIAYACVSERTGVSALEEVCNQLGYTACTFSAVDQLGRPVYHTNVVLSIASDFLLVSADAFCANKTLADNLKKSKRKIIELDFEQIKNFAANCLEVENKQGDRKLVISSRGWNSLRRSQQEDILQFCSVLTAPVETIETVGGGGIRCMLTGLNF